MTGVDRMLYQVKKGDAYYFLEKSVGGILYIGDYRTMINAKKGGMKDFQRKGLHIIGFNKRGTES